MQIGFASLPIVTPAPKARRDLVLPPPTQLELPAKGVVPPPKAAKEIITKGVPAGGAVGGLGFWGWIAAHPFETAGPGLGRARAGGGGGGGVNPPAPARPEGAAPGPP